MTFSSTTPLETSAHMHVQPAVEMTAADKRARLALTFATTYAVLLFVVGVGQITDPFIHFDDYPALMLWKEGYYEKTLAEGRWFNYLWFFRGIETPPWVNFQLYLTGSALFVAATALSIFRTAPARIPVILAALIVLSPQTTLITGWFNTLIPGLWVMAAYAITTLFTSPQTGVRLLFLFVPIAIQAYTPYPFLMFAICLMREDRDKSFAALVKCVIAFIASFALGLLIIFSINYAVHGVFGVALSDWRDPTPAEDIWGYVANFPKLAESLSWTYQMTGFGQPALSLGIALALIASLVVISRHDKLEVLAIFLGIMSGMSLLSIHALQEGILFPFRSTYFLWVMIVIALMRAATLLETTSERRSSAPFAALIVLTLMLVALVRMHHQTLSAWQVASLEIIDTVPAETETVYVFGSYLTLGEYEEARTQMPRDFEYRLEYRRGMAVFMCSEPPFRCDGVTPPFDVTPGVSDLLQVQDGTTTYLRLPVVEVRPR